MIDFGALYRAESRRVLATLIRLLRDFDLAEEALHDAFVAAAEQWPRDGLPHHPRAWLVGAGRLSALARLRRRARFDRLQGELAGQMEESMQIELDTDAPAIGDDRLRLVFTCCHPSLGADAQIAVTLREVCGLTTEEIASAFLVKPATIAQRIVRTKRKIREEAIPYEIPGAAELPERLDVVLHVIYLVFNEGYAASSGARLTRGDLCAEAIDLARLLAELLPEPDVLGLLALLLLHDARREARASSTGDVVLLADQDRACWNRAQIDEGIGLLRRAWARPPVGTYTLQAAIAAEHARAPDSASTDWDQIVRLYDLLLIAERTPVVELNRAAAISQHRGPEAGLALMDALLERGELRDYRFLHSARADLLRKLGRRDDARAAYRRALELTTQEPERRFLERRSRDVEESC
ncbi:RNA polymerase sigma factor [Sorangium sp. So ce861]|uniref:RNA polymerase sigma factor n=1 Tax=Sorangium sp. So ce861 TaxID=3133323 RepID=UPI003F6272AA